MKIIKNLIRRFIMLLCSAAEGYNQASSGNFALKKCYYCGRLNIYEVGHFTAEDKAKGIAYVCNRKPCVEKLDQDLKDVKEENENLRKVRSDLSVMMEKYKAENQTDRK